MMLGQEAGWGKGEAGVGGVQEAAIAHSAPALSEATARRGRTGGGCWGGVVTTGQGLRWGVGGGGAEAGVCGTGRCRRGRAHAGSQPGGGGLG